MRGSEHSGAVRLLGLSRSGYYYRQSGTPENLALMQQLDDRSGASVLRESTATRVVASGGTGGESQRVSRLLQVMGIEAIYPRPFRANPKRGIGSVRTCWKGWKSGPNQVWCADITYVPMAYGYMYLVAVMDWWSRYVLGWELSNSQEAGFCVRAWERRWSWAMACR